MANVDLKGFSTLRAPSLAISARRLVKRFGEIAAVAGVARQVPSGMIFAVLGPNGDGKTTLLWMLATLSQPDAGSAQIMGHDLRLAAHEVRGSIVMIGQFASLNEDLTGHENLIILAGSGALGSGMRARADELFEAFDLA